MIEITPEDICRLNSDQLTNLLRRLLHLEAHQYEIPKRAVSVSLKITVPDGGEDGDIEWEGGPEKTDYLPKRKICFQSKARDTFTQSDALKEFINKGAVKPMIEETLSVGGAYIFFVGCQLNSFQIEKIQKKVRKKLKEMSKSYADQCVIEVYDADKISGWTQKFLAPAIYVGSQIGKEIIPGGKIWQEWASTEKIDQIPFVPNDEIENYMKDIRNLFLISKSSIRLIGLSGLGKTRIVLETFRPNENNLVHQINNFNIVYVDAHGKNGIEGAIISWIRNNISGLLVLDNCPLDLHQTVKKEIERPESQLSLLTINNDPVESMQGITFIKLKPFSNEHIKSILKLYYPNMPTSDISRIIQFARGFPIIAVNLAKAKLRQDPDLGRLNEDLLLNSLIWGTKPYDEEADRIIEACSIFEHIGFEPPFDSQYKEVSKLFEIKPENFYRHVKTFMERGIIEQYGHYINVRPIPLALELACRWWTLASPDCIQKLLENLTDPLASAMCLRMRQLDFLEDAKKFVDHICGDQGPFGQAEVLNTERGSQCFRNFVEVNPSASASSIQQAFLGWSTQKLKEVVGPGRRNLIWALEKLAFRKETFNISANLLLRLGAAENESWTNNATGVFLNLFHVQLPGTEAPPLLRLKVIDGALYGDDMDIKNLGIKALSHVLQNSIFSRTLGAEQQGSLTTLEEWKPKCWQEVFDYWEAAVERLIGLIESTDESLSNEAIKIIGDRLYELVISNEMVSILNRAVQKILIKKNNFWPKGYKVIRKIVVDREMNLSDEYFSIVNSWLTLLSPETQSHDNQIEMIINWPVIDNWEEQRDAAKSFAERVANKFDSWSGKLELFFKGNQCQGFLFGERLCELLNELDVNIFLDKGIKLLSDSKSSDRKCIIIGGFLKSYNQKFPLKVKEILDLFFNKPELQRFFLPLCSMIGLTDSRLSQISELAKTGVITVNQIKELCYACSINNIDPREIINLAKNVSGISQSGCWIALQIIFLYSHKNNLNWKKIKPYLREMIISEKISFSKLSTRTDRMDDYNLEETIVNILLESDDELAAYVTNDIILYLKTIGHDYEIQKNILKILLERYLKICWPIFSKSLLSNDLMVVESLCMLLGVEFKNKTNGSILFQIVPKDFIFDWIKSHGNRAAIIVARITPIFSEDEKNEINWHPVAKWLIDHFGSDEKVLSALSINMGTGSWSGSLVPYLISLEKLYSVLQDHCFESVRNWAIQNMRYVNNNRKQQELYEEDGKYNF